VSGCFFLPFLPYYLVMKCPKCKLTLSVCDRQGFAIDYCPQCKGIWLDRGELDKIVERSQDPGHKKNTYEDDIRDGPRNWDFPVSGKLNEDHTRGRQRKLLLGELGFILKE